MQQPNKKRVSRLAPVLLYEPIVNHLKGFQGDFYGKFRKCPWCGSSNCKKHTIEEDKLFCKVIVNGKFVDVTVAVQVFYCKSCKRTFLAESPFYDGILYCQPVVDLCLYFAAKNPYHRVEKILMELGVQVDRDTVKNYTLKFEKKVKQYAGMELFGEVAGINLLKLMFGVKDVNQLKKKFPHEKFDGVADETYPTIKGGKKKFKEVNRQRKLENKEPFKYPKGFTLAVSYLALLKVYASLMLNQVAFCQIFSQLLLMPLLGADFLTTDGHGAYNIVDGMMEHLRCLYHKSKNLAKKDETLRKMKKNRKPPDEIKDYLSKKYKKLEKEALKELKEKFPKFFDDKGSFIGALTTNSIEGGNWRIKYELRTPYSSCESITGRTILVCLMDSIFTFRNGKPTESFAHKHCRFSFAKLMAS